MRRAIDLADLPASSVLPNPRVGAVLTYKNSIVGLGYHKGPGTAHAEREAIESATHAGFRNFSKSRLYINLEPCCHLNKRTPPCVPLILEKKIPEVFCAHLDPNPEVRGKGVQRLRAAGVKVKLGILKTEAELINQAYLKNQMKKKTYVSLKLAMSLDGKLALDNGESKWISSEESRLWVHELRRKIGCIGVGKKTVENDNPSLNTRLGKKKFSNQIVIFGKPKNLKNKSLLKENKTTQPICLSQNKKMNTHFKSLFRDHEIGQILVEGGAEISSKLLKEKEADEVFIFVAPVIFGGKAKYSLGKNWNFKSVSSALWLPEPDLQYIGEDVMFHFRLHDYHSQ